jgi:septal ring factor EnvC (AmiA/AmiB activator)
LKSKHEAPPVAEAKEFDIQNISHLHEVPIVAELYSKRGSLCEHQHALEAQLREAQQALARLQNTQDFSATVARRELQDTLEDLERQGAALEAQLREVQQTLEATEERVTAAMTPTLAREGVPIVEELLEVLDRLADVVQRYSAYGQRTRRLLNTHLVPLLWSLAYILGCREPLRRVLAKLQRVSQE